MRTSGNYLEENRQIKISPTPLFSDFAKLNACQIFPLYSITQLLRLSAAENLDVFCRRSELGITFMTGQENTSVGLSLHIVHKRLPQNPTQKTTWGLVNQEVKTNHYDVPFG